MSGENVLTCTVKDLFVNCEYYFRVKAVNKVGAGEYLELRNPVIIEEIKRKSFSQLDNSGGLISVVIVSIVILTFSSVQFHTVSLILCE